MAAGSPGTGNFTWAQLNPFAKADRGELPPSPQPIVKDNKTEETEIVDPNDPTKKIKKQPGTEDDPLLQFDSLWQPNKDAKGEDIVEDNTPQPFLPKLDTKKLNEMVGKMNFTSDITQEQLDAVKAGGDGATNALLTIINQSSRKAFTVSLAAATKMAEQGLVTAQERFNGAIPDHVRDLVTDNELNNSVTIMRNPAFAPLVASVKSQYLKKFPKASPSEVNSGVKQYFDYMAKELSKKPEDQTKTPDNQTKLRKGDPGADFMEWIEKDLVRGSSASPFANSTQDDLPQQ